MGFTQTPSIPFFGYEITLEGLTGDLFLMRQTPETTQWKDVLLRNCDFWIPASLSSHWILPRPGLLPGQVLGSFCPKPLIPKQLIYKLTKIQHIFSRILPLAKLTLWLPQCWWTELWKLLWAPVVVELPGRAADTAQPGDERRDFCRRSRILHKLSCEITPLWPSADSE